MKSLLGPGSAGLRPAWMLEGSIVIQAEGEFFQCQYGGAALVFVNPRSPSPHLGVNLRHALKPHNGGLNQKPELIGIKDGRWNLCARKSASSIELKAGLSSRVKMCAT